MNSDRLVDPDFDDPRYIALKKDYADFVENTWQVYIAAKDKIGLWPEHEQLFEKLWKDKAKKLGIIP